MTASRTATAIGIGIVAIAASLCYVLIKEGLLYAPPLRFAGFAAWLRGETPESFEWIGMGVILSGLAVAGLEPLVRKITRPLPADSV